MISKTDFVRLRKLIYEQSGINLSADKKIMLELRIKRCFVELKSALLRRVL